MRKRNWLFAAALASAAIGGTALAQDTATSPPPPRGHMGMMQADTNGDGSISRAEYDAWVSQRIAQRAANPAPGGRRMDDGAYRRAAGQRFDRIDTNHDGVLEPQELAAMRDLMRFRMSGRAGDQAGPDGTGGPRMRGHGGRGMAAADTNGDGRISRAEFLAQAGARFDRMDTNHDGYLDASERPMRHRHRDGMTPPAPPMPPAGQ